MAVAGHNNGICKLSIDNHLNDSFALIPQRTIGNSLLWKHAQKTTSVGGYCCCWIQLYCVSTVGGNNSNVYRGCVPNIYCSVRTIAIYGQPCHSIVRANAATLCPLPKIICCSVTISSVDRQRYQSVVVNTIYRIDGVASLLWLTLSIDRQRCQSIVVNNASPME